MIAVWVDEEGSEDGRCATDVRQALGPGVVYSLSCLNTARVVRVMDGVLSE